MKKLFNNDMFVRLFSLVTAVLCWVYIIFITNPEIEVKVTGIPITLADHQSIKKEGYVVSNEINTTVDIRIKGTRQMLANINKDNIIAYVDLMACTSKGTYKLPVSIKLPYEEVSVVSKSIYNISVAVDTYSTRNFDLEYTYSGELKSQDYMIYNTELSKDKITVSGPEDIIKTIEKATVSINLDKASDDIDGTTTVRLLNSNNSEVSSDVLEVKDSEIAYKCEIYQKKSVDVIPSFDNNSNIKYAVTDYPTVTLIGPSADIDKIDSVKTNEITYDKETLPHTYRVKLVIPEKIETEGNISYVNVLVENK